MGLDSVEVVEILHVLTGELKAAMTDSKTPGKITPLEWANIAQKVGVKAFQEVID